MLGAKRVRSGSFFFFQFFFFCVLFLGRFLDVSENKVMFSHTYRPKNGVCSRVFVRIFWVICGVLLFLKINKTAFKGFF